MKKYNIKELFRKIFKGIRNYKHPILKLFVIVFVFLIIINVAYYFVSAYSPGCLVCHYMKPYYEQSSHSVHKDVSCVKCHPNRRLLTAPYLLRYIAGSYNPRPRAQVDDKICLDCHESQNLKKQTAFEMNISFNHSDHLGDLKRGKNLRCTSCHARGEQEQHFVLNKNVCFTCHFKGAERGHSVTGCSVCHGIPKKIVKHNGFQFNHESYLKIGVDCSQCHIDVTTGNAEVEKKVCYKCHVERTEEFSNTEKIHNVHITKNGVDCEECHNSIKHGKVKMISLLEANCENCHSLKHTPQREMYIGSEGRGVSSIPSKMFAAQVTCEGCHLDLNNDGKSDLSEKKQACIKCHAPGYDKMLDDWISGMNKAVNSITPGIEHVKQLISGAEKQGKNIDAEKTYYQDVETNFKLVKEGKGVHNLDYALKLLENIANNIEGISNRLGDKNFKVDRSKLFTDDKDYCNLCHSSFQPRVVEKFGEENFPHSNHMKFLSCNKCHSRSEHKKITVTKEVCQECHQNFKKLPENIRYGSINFPHLIHSRDKNIECTICHTSTDFTKIQIKKHACTSCHHKDNGIKGKPDCSECHPVQNNTYNGTLFGQKFDADLMKSGGVECKDCHAPNKTNVTRPNETVCVGCHDASYRNTQIEWKNDIRTKSSSVNSLTVTVNKKNLTDEEKTKIQYAKKILSVIRSDGSGGLHNYMVFSSILEKSIKDLNQLLKGEK
ncbi:MAG TPA: cytochrome c3 family protein [Ignavibacteria bacterium]